MAWLPAAARSLGSKEATAGQPAPASPDWGLDPRVPWSGVDSREGAKREGGAMGSQGCPTPGPRPPGQTRNLESRASLSQRAGAPATTLPGHCPAAGLAFRGAAPPCSYGSAVGGKGPLPQSLLLQKREKPRAQPAPPWLGAHFRLLASFFPKRDQMTGSWLGGGATLTAGNRWGQGLASDLQHTCGAGPPSGRAATLPRG